MRAPRAREGGTRRTRLASGDAEALAGAYERHIEYEETEVLPMARRLLSDDDLDRIGRAMREGVAAEAPTEFRRSR